MMDNKPRRSNWPESMIRPTAGILAFYVALMAFCAAGAGLLPLPAQRAMKPYVWLMGPPANLVHGTKFLPPFLLGSLAVVGMSLCIVRAQSMTIKGVCCVVLVIAWAVFGFIAYAPGA